MICKLFNINAVCQSKNKFRKVQYTFVVAEETHAEAEATTVKVAEEAAAPGLL
jgi:hypothetical protein